MADYQPPLPAHLLLHDFYRALLPNLADTELTQTILAAAGELAAEAFAPLNWSANLVGAKLTGSGVAMPAGCVAAYQAFQAGGWNGLCQPEAIGGQGQSHLLGLAVAEFLQSANMSLALVTLLNDGATTLLAKHGSEQLKAIYLEKLVSGEWTGTMNLTEPQAGSDLAAIRCRAEPAGDAYKIFGQKIFISYGEHDLTPNIIHFVLARLPDAPAGTKGLSLFLVPRFLVNADGSLGNANDVRAISLEHKLGLHASPTCVMSYGEAGGATGWLVGAPHGGIAAMFTMMNHARLGVGLQGLAISERATQAAIAYTRTRLQGKKMGRKSETMVPIIEHPDVRRTLLLMQAKLQAGRALLYQAYAALDLGEAGQAQVDWLTPIAKAWLTDEANLICSDAIQLHGGMGYVEETGVAQHYRDARVLGIYEGTNGIQAQDLVFRKLLVSPGPTAFEQSVNKTLLQAEQVIGDDFVVMTNNLRVAHQHFAEASQWLRQQAARDVALAASAATDYLQLSSLLAAGSASIALACFASLALQRGDYQGSMAQSAARSVLLARAFADYELTKTGPLLHRILNASSLPLASHPDDF